MDPTDPYHQAREAAKAWLGDKYLLAKPINRRNPSGNDSNDQDPGQRSEV